MPQHITLDRVAKKLLDERAKAELATAQAGKQLNLFTYTNYGIPKEELQEKTPEQKTVRNGEQRRNSPLEGTSH